MSNFFSFLVPPYGQEDLQDLQSIFEIPHLREQVILLDTQCELYYVQSENNLNKFFNFKIGCHPKSATLYRN